MSKKSKWLHEFVINKQDKTMESHTETNDKGEKITTEKEVVKDIPTYFAIKKPTRKLFDESDLFYSVKLSEGIKNTVPLSIDVDIKFPPLTL